MIDYQAYRQSIENRLNQNKIPTTIENAQGVLIGIYDENAIGGFELTEEFLVEENNLGDFAVFLIDEFIKVLKSGEAGGLVPLAEDATDTEINTTDDNANPITFNNRQKLIDEARPIIIELLEKEEVDLTVDKYRILVGVFSYYLQFLEFDKETNGSTNPNAVPTAGTFILECDVNVNTTGNIFKQAFVDLSTYTYFQDGSTESGSEVKVRAMIPSKWIEGLKKIADACKGGFLGQDPTPTKTVTETKNPKQMEKLTAMLDSTTREIIGTNMTMDMVGTPNPDGGLWSSNQMKNIVVGTYEVEPMPYTVDGDKITYQLSDPVLVDAQWTSIK